MSATNQPTEEGARDDYASKTRDSEDLERDLRRGILPGWLHRITDDRLPPTFGRYRQASSKPPKTPFIQYIYRSGAGSCISILVQGVGNKTTRTHEIDVIARFLFNFSSALQQMKEVKDQWGAF